MSAIKIEDYGDGVRGIVFDRQGSTHNFISREVVKELHGVVRSLTLDKDVKGVVITSAKKSFLVGGDLKELRSLKSSEEAAEIISDVQACMRAIERAEKPFVAAINGSALGGGLEIALSCTYRVASDDPTVKMGLPEVSLGLMPGGGGTQRLPRLTGLAAALPIMVENRQVTPGKALEIGLVDEIVAGRDLTIRAKESIRSGVAPADQPWDRDAFNLPGVLPDSSEGIDILQAMWTKLRQKKPGLEPAPEAILEVVEKGLLTGFEEGLLLEREKFASIAASPSVKNKIRTLFVGLNEAQRMKNRPKDIHPYEIKSVSVVGIGQMGSGIAYCAALAGYEVILLEKERDRLESGVASIREKLRRAVDRGRMLPDKAEDVFARLRPSTDYSDISGVDLVFEAVSEVLDIKEKVIATVCAQVRNDVPIATNTSTIPIKTLAGSAINPERFIGLHFFSPVERMKLVEVIKGGQTDKPTLARALDVIAGMRKIPIVVNDGLGFFTSRVVASYTGEAFTLMAEGLAPDIIDDVAVKAGLPIGPLAMADITSLTLLKDIVTSIMGDGSATGLIGLRLLETLERLTEEGRSGKDSGRGIYDYDGSGQKPWPGLADCFPPSVETLDRGIIEKRLLYAQSLEAARAIEEGVIEDAIDADVASVLGWAFPSSYGGVIGLIDTIGSAQFLTECDELKDKFGGRFEAPAIIRDMADRGMSFFSE